MTRERLAVLIVERDTATRELYERELHRTYQVLTTASVEQTLQVLQTTDVAAVVIEPAGLDDAGWNLVAAIRSMHPRDTVRVILCSALDERKRGMALGVAAYLVKPVLPVTLLDTLDHVLQVPVQGT